MRVTAFAALTANGCTSAAAELRRSPADDDGDTDEMLRLERALRRAMEHVLATPPLPEDRPLLILLAAREAVAIAAVREPEPRHTAALLQSAAVVEQFAHEADAVRWHVHQDPPPRRPRVADGTWLVTHASYG